MIQAHRSKPYHSPWLIRRPEPVDWFRLLADLHGLLALRLDLGQRLARGLLQRVGHDGAGGVDRCGAHGFPR